MKKYILDLKVVSVEPLSDKHVLIKLTDDKALPEILPGQFVEVRVDHSPATMLRRPISINFVDREQNQLWLLVAVVGDGTRQLSKLQQGDVLNCMLPLGNGFTMPTAPGQRYLLVGGGVGVAPFSNRPARVGRVCQVWQSVHHHRGRQCWRARFCYQPFHPSARAFRHDQHLWS